MEQQLLPSMHPQGTAATVARGGHQLRISGIRRDFSSGSRRGSRASSQSAELRRPSWGEMHALSLWVSACCSP